MLSAAIRRLPTRILPSGPTRPATTLVARSPHFGHDDLSSSTRKQPGHGWTRPGAGRTGSALRRDVDSHRVLRLPCRRGVEIASYRGTAGAMTVSTRPVRAEGVTPWALRSLGSV